jgi:hypothetical protein
VGHVVARKDDAAEVQDAHHQEQDDQDHERELDERLTAWFCLATRHAVHDP